MAIGNTNIHKKLMSENINKTVSFVFSEFNRVANWKRQNHHYCTIIISNSQIENLVSFSRSTNVNVNMSFPNSNFEGNFSTYCLARHFDIIESWKLIVGHRVIYYST